MTELRPTKAPKLFSASVLFAMLLVLGAGLGFTIRQTQALPAASCPAITYDLRTDPKQEHPIYPTVPTGLPSPGFIVFGVVCAVLGHSLGHLRNRRQYANARQSNGVLELNRRGIRPRVGSTVLALVFFLFAAAALFYEAAGVLRVPDPSSATNVYEPITYYIRCAIHYDQFPISSQPWSERFPWLTVLLVGSFCTLLGHWLWFPAQPRLADPGKPDAG